MDRTQRIFTLAAFALVPIAGVLVANCTNDFGKFNVVAGTGGTVTTSSTTSSSTTTSGAGGQTGGAGGVPNGGAGGVPNGGAGGVPNGGAGGVPNGGGGAGGSGGSTCGDDVLDPGEGCDDSDVAPGNGCSATCAIEGQSNCVTPTAIALDPPGIWIGDTTANHQNITNTTCGGTSARDVVYAITPTQSATVNIDLTGGYNKIMAIRAACNSGGAEAYCQASLNALNTTFAATANTTFYVVVSGVTGAQGAFVLHVYY